MTDFRFSFVGKSFSQSLEFALTKNSRENRGSQFFSFAAALFFIRYSRIIQSSSLDTYIHVYLYCNFLFQSLGCLLYAIANFKSPFDIVLEKGDSVALAVQSGLPSNAKFLSNSSFSQGFQDLISWMLTVDLQKRPFINDIMTKVSLLIETSEDKL